MDRKFAKEFARMQVQVMEPRPAFDMHIAVWAKPGQGECVIGAPSLESLQERWFQITRTSLDSSRVQHVLVMLDGAPNRAGSIATGD